MSAVLEVEGLAKSFVSGRNLLGRPTGRVEAVKDVTLSVLRGETVGLVGESGAGKSTVGRLVLRLIEPDHGTIRLTGTDVRALGQRDLRKMRARARMIFQDPFASLDPSMTVGDLVAQPLLIHTDIPRSRRRSRVAELMRDVGMSEHHIDRHPHEFSGGQLQRVAVARAIATNPDLIVCDEAVAALDMSIRAQVINLLRDIQRDHGIGYLFISHDLSLVGHIAQRVAVMYRGRIVELGPTESLFAEPRHPYTRDLLSAIPMPRPGRGGRERRRRRISTDVQLDLIGCDYADRCPEVMPICSELRPERRLVGDVDVACHLHSATPTAVSIRPTPLADAPRDGS